MFGYLEKNAVIKNIQLENVNIVGFEYVGAIAGYNAGGKIEKSKVEGKIIGHDKAGAFTGLNAGIIEESYSMADVEGTYFIGGISGANFNGKIKNTYSYGKIKGEENVGGITGINLDAKISYCYTKTEVTGKINTHNIIGNNMGEISETYYLKEQMNNQNTFKNWNFNNIWNIKSNKTYPYLIWQESNEHNYIETYTINISSKPENKGYLNRSGLYGKNTELILKAEAIEGYYFSHWSGDLISNVQPIKISVTQDMNITAHFNEIKIDLENAIENKDTEKVSNILNQISISGNNENYNLYSKTLYPYKEGNWTYTYKKMLENNEKYAYLFKEVAETDRYYLGTKFIINPYFSYTTYLKDYDSIEETFILKENATYYGIKVITPFFIEVNYPKENIFGYFYTGLGISYSPNNKNFRFDLPIGLTANMMELIFESPLNIWKGNLFSGGLLYDTHYGFGIYIDGLFLPFSGTLFNTITYNVKVGALYKKEFIQFVEFSAGLSFGGPKFKDRLKSAK